MHCSQNSMGDSKVICMLRRYFSASALLFETRRTRLAVCHACCGAVAARRTCCAAPGRRPAAAAPVLASGAGCCGAGGTDACAEAKQPSANTSPGVEGIAHWQDSTCSTCPLASKFLAACEPYFCSFFQSICTLINCGSFSLHCRIGLAHSWYTPLYTRGASCVG